MKRIYLDANSTTRVYPEVVEEMLPFFLEKYGNASSVHAFGREAKRHLEKARVKIAEFIQAESPEEVIFTSGGTESNNFAIKGIAARLKDKGNHIITSSSEHPSVLNTCKFLEEKGFKVSYLSIDNYGIIDLEKLEKAINPHTILVSIMAANNETGTIMPINDIGKITSKRGVIFHTDAVQFVGKAPFSVKEAGVELASISSHKINGPKGIGALYIKKGIAPIPYQHGGHQERNKRGGTENVPAIVGFGKACEITQKTSGKNLPKIKKLRDILHKGIESMVKDVKLNGHPEKRLVNTLNIAFQHLEGKSIVMNLDLEGISVSTGSACTSGNIEESHVLKSMKVDPSFIQGAVRFSLDVFNAKEDMEYVIKKLPPIITRLR